MTTYTFTEAQLKKTIEDALKAAVPSIVEKLTSGQKKTASKTATEKKTKATASASDADEGDIEKMTPKQLEAHIIKNGWKLPPPSKKNKRGGFPKADLLEIVKNNTASSSEEKTDRGRSKSRSRKTVDIEFDSELGVMADTDGWVYDTENKKVYAKVVDGEVVTLTAADIKSLKTSKIEVLSDKPLSAAKVKEQNEKTVDANDVPVESENEGEYYSVDAEDIEPEEGEQEEENEEENEDAEEPGVDEKAEDEEEEFFDDREATAKEYETYMKAVSSGKVKIGDAASIAKFSKLDLDLVENIIEKDKRYQNMYMKIYKKYAPEETPKGKGKAPAPEPKKTAGAATKVPVGKKMLTKK